MKPKSIEPRVAAVVLAAGKSSRMAGENKLLLPFRGRPLILHTLAALRDAGLSQIVVVVGHERERLRAVLPDRITVVFNRDYEEGMASSIRAGIAALPSQVEAAFIVQGDMPLLHADILRMLMSRYDSEQANSIIVPVYRGRQANPVLFPRAYFPELLQLQGDTGAKRLLAERAAVIVPVPMEDPAVVTDIDTPEAYERLQRQE
ncbi:MAG: nucleotidyltransferase family protein [candidate division KSB1 bacterium]|nr:nucleotidyltransferase family protein [candidate division KSB1 bacterium]MDQ7063271.1 nucleotidyltransferase family protein [candidate division KSB1 bacterium]